MLAFDLDVIEAPCEIKATELNRGIDYRKRSQLRWNRDPFALKAREHATDHVAPGSDGPCGPGARSSSDQNI